MCYHGLLSCLGDVSAMFRIRRRESALGVVETRLGRVTCEVPIINRRSFEVRDFEN